MKIYSSGLGNLNHAGHLLRFAWAEMAWAGQWLGMGCAGYGLVWALCWTWSGLGMGRTGP
jgi:hypothetical protein